MSSRLTEKSVRDTLTDVITSDDEVVVIFSGIWMFGSRLGVPTSDVPKLLVDVICDFLGSHRTLLFPTYTYAYTKTRIFDRLTSPPETGVLPAHALTRSEFERTRSPLNSYAVVGPRSGEACSIEDETLWGDASVMGWFDAVNARICVLGEPWHVACTHFHRAEEALRVPYRYFKRFPGALHEDGSWVRDVSPVMFVRPLNATLVRNYTGVAPIMRSNGHVRRGRSDEFPLESALARDIVSACTELLRADPLGYLSNKDEIGRWIRDEKSREMEALPDDERVNWNDRGLP